MLIAVGPVRVARTETSGPALVSALKGMAVAQLAYALLFALGILL
jgi:1,4-dihydroxy-2-naphthoate octaprenyltransferase